MENSHNIEVTLKELITDLLKKSWIIFISILLFSSFLVGYKYISDNKKYKSTPKNKEDIISSMTKEEIDAVYLVSKITANLSEKQNYLENSILMKINPYKKELNTLQYYINTGYVIDYTAQTPKDYTLDLISAYVKYIQSGHVLNSLDTTTESAEKIYIMDLITVQQYENSLAISITGENAENIKKVTEIIENSLNSYQNFLESKIGNHELILVDKLSSVVVDENLLSLQNRLTTEISELKTEYKTLTASFTSAQNQLLFGTEIDSNTIPKPTFDKKYLLIGIVTGLFLSIAYIILSYIFSGTLKTWKEVQNIYDLKVIGELRRAPVKKSPIHFGKNCIYNIFFRKKYPVKEQQAIIIMQLFLICKKRNVKKLFIATTLQSKKMDMDLISLLINELQSYGITAVFGENILQNSRSFQNLTQNDNILVIEQINVSKHSALKQELLIFREQEANVLGAILLL